MTLTPQMPHSIDVAPPPAHYTSTTTATRRTRPQHDTEPGHNSHAGRRGLDPEGEREGLDCAAPHHLPQRGATSTEHKPVHHRACCIY
ncbi:hypothetical protein GDO81_025674 [Engystomops pustulosus]|uniref:Uncharacterized protein n=1 Tax=Engystomops pustulosus TaxID=76066 RepID=A0AAV6Z072_ENGPU|nr:hypothetical protein GDO81_025674 [Engystomops pustulosus]